MVDLFYANTSALRIRRELVYALLMPQVLHCLEVMSAYSRVTFRRLGRLANMIVRFVDYIRHWSRASSSPPLIILGCIFSNFLKCRYIVLYHNVIRNGFPSPLSGTFILQRSSQNLLLQIPRILDRIEFERSFAM